ncbi:unnamed protein product [Coffea canephora]|uniref:DH200=94 genomic scaffold, scaffold_1161 n=1 Tax=Coffea canephora TaxID=49390 RepID=A0A068VIF0_COFCA|nr:unnamed protein product [Coffea canephora]
MVDGLINCVGYVFHLSIFHSQLQSFLATTCSISIQLLKRFKKANMCSAADHPSIALRLLHQKCGPNGPIQSGKAQRLVILGGTGKQ